MLEVGLEQTGQEIQTSDVGHGAGSGGYDLLVIQTSPMGQGMAKTGKIMLAVGLDPVTSESYWPLSNL